MIVYKVLLCIEIMLSLWLTMSGENSSTYPRRNLPKRPVGPEDLGWPSPTPLPLFPSEDVNKVLQKILERLEAIEKRLGNIEKMLMQRQTNP
jgi:hypothetical protein